MGIRQRVAHAPLALLLVSGALLLLGAWPARAAAADTAYADALIAAARAQQLADDPQWLALVHYQLRRLGGMRSAVDSPWFFQAPDGATDPQAELDATLRVFFDADARLKDGEPPQCALRARYEWLDSRLQFDAQRLPPQNCVEFDEWRAGLGATGVTLIFPEAYMNNPASMFGHTLLRLDTGRPGERKDLLAYGTNFSADPGSDGGLAFTFKGLLGYYPGRFAIQPYYEVVTQYGDWEQRDIWEYELSLTPAEVDLMLAHLWELRGVEFDYYFFDENCSYQLLALLEAARPDLHLKEQFGVWVIPTDTVRIVVAEPGLVTSTSYRASAGTRLRHAARLMPAPQRALASGIADGDTAPDAPALSSVEGPAVAGLDDSGRAAVLGTAYDLFRYRYLTEHVATADEQARARAILVARSRVPVEGAPLPLPPTPAIRPDQGHRSSRVTTGVGVRDGQFYLEARIRPAYHDLLDPSGGFTAGAQIEFLDLTFRYYTKHEEPRVHRFALFDIFSIAPVDAFFFPVSWKIGTELFSRLLPDQRGALEEEYVWRTAGGAGLAIEPWSAALAYAFVDATVDYSPALEEDHAIGPGGSIGLFFGPAAERWKGHLYATVTRFALGDVSTDSALGLDARLTLTPQMAIKAGVSGHRDFDQNWLEAGMTWNVYF